MNTTDSKLPLLDGGFWQMGPLLQKDWSDNAYIAEVGHMVDLGMNILIIQYGAWWDKDEWTLRSLYPSTSIPTETSFIDRDTIRDILKAADQLNVQVYLGDFTIPRNWLDDPARWTAWWNDSSHTKFRQDFVREFSNHPSFAGVYLPNQPNPTNILDKNVRDLWINATRTAAATIKETNPALSIVHSIGLYGQSSEFGYPLPPKPDFLDTFWRPWIKDIPEIDTWILLDGIGTELSFLDHTKTSQAWGKSICQEYGKSFWVDVENAHMSFDCNNHSFTLEELIPSLKIASMYGDKLITFDYLHYMSQLSTKAEARQLHMDYREYRKKLVP